MLSPVPGLNQPLDPVLLAPRADPPYTLQELTPAVHFLLEMDHLDQSFSSRVQRDLLTALLGALLPNEPVDTVLARLSQLSLTELSALPLEESPAALQLRTVLLQLKDMRPGTSESLWLGIQSKIQSSLMFPRAERNGQDGEAVTTEASLAFPPASLHTRAMTKKAAKAPAKKASPKAAVATPTTTASDAGKIGKTQLVDLVADKTGLTKKQSEDAVVAALEIMVAAMKAGQSVGLAGLGTLSVKATAARTGVKPGTSEKIQIPAGKKVSFKVATTLKGTL